MCTCYLDSTFIGHARHQDLFKHFILALDLLDLKKLLQVSMDDPNRNWAFFSELCNYQTENDMSKLLSTESCFQNWRAEHRLETQKVFRVLHQILHDSSARQNDYADVTRSSQFPLPFSGTRWIEDEQVVVRAI